MADRGRGGLDDILGLRIRLAHGAVQRHFADHFAALGVTQKQVSVLWLTGDQPGIAQTDLARALQMDRATTMAIVHALEKRTLLAREPVASDARRIGLRLTPEGALLLDEARDAIASHEAWLTSRFTAAERATLSELLRRIYD
ncbi:MAG: MarR family transcriptional regulator [Proteobacteria bacterium]|nr:MarR family transcriptional regulator [Pseudomonadota bacterium]